VAQAAKPHTAKRRIGRRRPRRSTRSTCWRWQQIGQHTDQFNSDPAGGRGSGKSLQWWAFLLLFIGFVIKVPAVPLHTWLPDAHVEAPTPISMILAGVLLKMGGYGIIRICYPICPHGGYELAYFVCGWAWSAWSTGPSPRWRRRTSSGWWPTARSATWATSCWAGRLVGDGRQRLQSRLLEHGREGAMFQMIAHGISSAGMFFMVGVIYDRVHHRNLDKFGGLFGKMPVYTALAIGIFFAGLGCRGCAGSSAKVLVVSVWNYSYVLAVISAVGGDPDGRLHPVDDPARVPGRRVQGPARRAWGRSCRSW
jgi:NADH-quinone oxidoreductase subunit M